MMLNFVLVSMFGLLSIVRGICILFILCSKLVRFVRWIFVLFSVRFLVRVIISL